MSVTFNRAQLITVATAALAGHQKAKIAYAKAVEDYRREHAVQHWEDHRAALHGLRDLITKSLRTGSPITRAQARKAAHGINDVEYLFYTPPADYQVKEHVTTPTGLLTPAEVVETNALLTVLEAAIGDTISANELKLLGLRNLQPVFIAAAGDRTPRPTGKAR